MATTCVKPGCQYDGECRSGTAGGGLCGLLSCERKLCGDHSAEKQAAFLGRPVQQSYCRKHDIFDCPFCPIGG